MLEVTNRAREFALTFALGILLASFTTHTNAQTLDQAEFQQLHDQLDPGEEVWKSIPWQTNLLKAQELAAESKLPLFIWAMDGHPLGCT